MGLVRKNDVFVYSGVNILPNQNTACVGKYRLGAPPHADDWNGEGAAVQQQCVCVHKAIV